MFSASQTWVKNVYSLCVPGALSGEYLYTPSTTYLSLPTKLSVKPHFFTPFIDSFTPRSYTSFLTQLHPLIDHLYTLSTVPTIKKMKKK